MQPQPQPTLRLPVFEGPFDLLYHLVKKAEVDIWAVSIAEITEQYLAYLRSMKELNLDIASEFLVMAATLLRLKSKLLLPRPPRSAVEDPEEAELYDISSPEELFQRLEEYRAFKVAAAALKDREREQQKIFLRSTGGPKIILVNRQQSYYTHWEGAGLLHAAAVRLLESAAARSSGITYYPVENHALPERMLLVLQRLAERREALPLGSLCLRRGLWEGVLTLMALLELARQRRIYLYQEKPFGVILAALRKSGKEAEDGGSVHSEAGH